MTDKEMFQSIARQLIKRDGLEPLLASLEKSDFYIAPASTKYHDSHEGGLVKHSIRVFNELFMECEHSFDHEQIAVVSLFHDLCKVGYYIVEMRNTKDERGNWIKVPYYTVNDLFPFGHGEKSVYMVNQFMKLGDEEALAMRWHMGGFEPSDNHKYVSKAYETTPLALYLHLADMKATYLPESYT